jgi:6-phosphogluconolactonase
MQYNSASAKMNMMITTEGKRAMKRWAEQGIAALGACALCLTVGCNGFFVYPGSIATDGTGSSTSNYVYVANTNTQSLAAFSVGSGTITAVTGSPFPLGFVPVAVVVNPANTIVYVAGGSSGENFINAYAIGTDGVLSLLTSNNIGITSDVSIDISPDGQWLMGLNSLSGAASEAILDEYRIENSSGELTLEPNAGGVYGYPQSPSPPTVHAWSIKFAPNGAYVFAAMGTGGDVVFPFTTSDGTFRTIPVWLKLLTNNSDQALAVSSDSSLLYITRNGSPGYLAVYTIASGGGLTPLTGSPFAAGSQPVSVALNKAGTDVYVANQGDNTISGYSVASGSVSILSTPTTSATSPPSALAIDNSGNYLLSLSSNGAPGLSMYSYDATTPGNLDLVTSTSTGIDTAGAIAIATTH